METKEEKIRGHPVPGIEETSYMTPKQLTLECVIKYKEISI